MGRERQARLERKELRQELIAMHRTRRRGFWLLLLVLIIGLGGGVAWGYQARKNSSGSTANATENTTPAANEVNETKRWRP